MAEHRKQPCAKLGKRVGPCRQQASVEVVAHGPERETRSHGFWCERHARNLRETLITPGWTIELAHPPSEDALRSYSRTWLAPSAASREDRRPASPLHIRPKVVLADFLRDPSKLPRVPPPFPYDPDECEP